MGRSKERSKIINLNFYIKNFELQVADFTLYGQSKKSKEYNMLTQENSKLALSNTVYVFFSVILSDVV